MRVLFAHAVALLAAIATSAPARAESILIVGDAGTYGTTLQTHLTNLGYTVTQQAGTQASYVGYSQVWDTRYDIALSATEKTNFASYLAAGGRLYFEGEAAYQDARNTSLVLFLTDIGAGTLTLVGDAADGSTQTFTTAGALLNTPNALASLSIALGRTATPSAAGLLVTETSAGSGQGTTFAWNFGDISTAPGARMYVTFDSNHPNPQTWTENVASFLGGRAATLVARWELDTAFTDSSGNGNHLTATGTAAIVQPGLVGSGAATFDGDQDAATTAAIDRTIFNAGLTVMGWIRPDVLAAMPIINSDRSFPGDVSLGWAIRMSGTGTFDLFMRDSGDKRLVAETSVGGLAADTWSHIAVTWDGSLSGGFSFYVNGAAVASTITASTGFTGFSGSFPIRIGGSQGDSASQFQWFDGEMDHLSVYSGAPLSAAAIAADYQAAGRVGYWQMEGDWSDASGNGNTGTPTGAALGAGGYYGQGGIFDGNDYVTMDGNGSLKVTGTAITVMAWVYATSLPNDFNFILERRVGTSDVYALHVSSGGAVSFSMEAGPTGSSASKAGLFTTGAWHHVAGTYDGATSTLYYDGLAVASTSRTGNLNSSDGAFHLGTNAATGRYWNGRLDEVDVYGRALSATEVAEVGLPRAGPGGIYRDMVMADSPVAYWRLGEASTPTAVDEVGARHGTYFGSPVLGTAGALPRDTAVSLGGTDTDYVIRNPFGSLPTAAATIEIWMRSSDTTNDGTPFSYASTNATNGLLLYNYRAFALYVGNPAIGTGVSANDGSWHHIVATWRSSDGEVTLYKDGALGFSGALQQGYALEQDGSLILGQEQDSVGDALSPAQRFVGTLDEVALYGFALSGERVSAHYQAALAEAARVRLWVGGASTSWGDGPNWSPSGTPAVSDDVHIQAGAGTTIQTAAAVTVRSLWLRAGNAAVLRVNHPLTITESLVITSGTLEVGTGSLAVTGEIAVNGGKLKGSVTGPGGAVTLTAGGTLQGSVAVGRKVVVGAGGRISPGE